MQYLDKATKRAIRTALFNELPNMFRLNTLSLWLIQADVLEFYEEVRTHSIVAKSYILGITKQEPNFIELGHIREFMRGEHIADNFSCNELFILHYETYLAFPIMFLSSLATLIELDNWQAYPHWKYFLTNTDLNNSPIKYLRFPERF